MLSGCVTAQQRRTARMVTLPVAVQGEPQGVMAVPGTRSAVAVLFASHVALRDFSAPSWRVGCGGAITALLPTSDVGRRLAGHVGVSSDGDLAGLSQLGPVCAQTLHAILAVRTP